jgi:AcrR family transcriptional regulator
MSLTHSYSTTNRERLIGQARRLFAERGFADVSVDQVAAAADLTKGAVYYQFRDKTDLFRAACQAVMDDIAESVDQAGRKLAISRAEGLATGGPRMFDAYANREAQRLLLIEAPAVLGFDSWMEMLEPSGICLVANGLEYWVETGRLPADQVPALSHLLFGAFIQGALRIASAPDPVAADLEVRAAVDTLMRGFMRGLETAPGGQ